MAWPLIAVKTTVRGYGSLSAGKNLPPSVTSVAIAGLARPEPI